MSAVIFTIPLFSPLTLNAAKKNAEWLKDVT
jgi:hypothetical protein